MLTKFNVQMSACFAIIGSIASTINGLVDSVWNPRTKLCCNASGK